MTQSTKSTADVAVATDFESVYEAAREAWLEFCDALTAEKDAHRELWELEEWFKPVHDEFYEALWVSTFAYQASLWDGTDPAAAFDTQRELFQRLSEAHASCDRAREVVEAARKHRSWCGEVHERAVSRLSAARAIRSLGADTFSEGEPPF